MNQLKMKDENTELGANVGSVLRRAHRVNTAGSGEVVLTSCYLVDGPEIKPVTRYLVKETADFSRCYGKMHGAENHCAPGSRKA